jgi:hypothetical protein
MRQSAPFPDALDALVKATAYRPGWTVRLRDMTRDHVDPADDRSAELSGGLTLVITTCGYDSYHPDRGETYRVHHYFPVPPATYTEASWRRWLFEQFLLVERHEAMEFFAIDGERPYAPNHGPGHDPYTVRELADDAARRTSFRGATKET